MALGDIYELVDRQTYLGQECINRYHFENVTEPGDAQALADAFIQDILVWITTAQSPSVLHHRIDVINLTNENDFHSEAISINGNSAFAGEDLPPFFAMRLVLNRSSRAIRNGAKRYTGVKEDMVSGHDLVGQQQGIMVTVAEALELPATAPQGGDFLLRLYGGVTPNRPTPIVVPIASVSAPFSVTTQNTRKTWSGN